MSGLAIGWIGTGVMGGAMASHVLGAGFNLSVNNIPPAHADPLVAKGATFKTPKQIAESCDMVFTMVGFPHDLESIVFGDDGLLKHMKEGSYLVDHTTSRPSLAQEIYKQAKQKGIKSVDAPVTGGDFGARAGTLLIFAGGEEQDISVASSVIKHYSSNINFVGGAGSGQHAKIANNLTLAGSLLGMAEGLQYIKSVGLDEAQIMKLIGDGAAGSPYYRGMIPKYMEGDYTPGYFVKHMVKDIEMGLKEMEDRNIVLPGLSMINQMFRSMYAYGEETDGVHALIKVIQRLNNKQRAIYD